MRVTAASGHYAIASVTVIVAERAPVVDPGEDLFVTTGDPEPVVLDACGGSAATCTTVDADDDPLTFVWSQLGGTPVSLESLDAANRRMRFTPVAATRPFSFGVRGSDGLREGGGVVQVHQEPQVWIRTMDPSRVYRLFPDFDVQTMFLTTSGMPTAFSALDVKSAAMDGDGNIWIAEPGKIRRIDLSTLMETKQWGAPPTVSEVVPGCAIAPGFGVIALLAAGTTTHGTIAYRHVFPSADGDCWVLGDDANGDQIHRLSASGIQPVVIDSDQVASAVSTGDGALWFAAGGLVRRVDSATRVVEDIAPLYCSGLAPDPRSLEQVLCTRSFSLLSVARDGSSEVQELSTDALGFVLSSLAGAGVSRPGLTADPESLAVWGVDTQTQAIRRLESDGVQGWVDAGMLDPEEIVAPTGSLIVEWVGGDPVSGKTIALVKTGSTRSLARIPAHMRRLAASPLDPADTFVAGDRARGTAWHTWLSPETLLKGVESRSWEGRSVATISPLALGPNVFSIDVFAPRPGGGIWAAGCPQEGAGGVLAAFDAEGTVEDLRSVSVCSDRLAVSANERFVIADVERLDRMTQIVDVLPPAVTVMALEDGGTAWGFDFTQGSSLLGFPAGSSTPVSITGTPGIPFNFPTSVRADPRGGAWVVDSANSRLVRVGPGGAPVTSFAINPSSLSLRKLCDDPASASCVEVWYATGTLQVTVANGALVTSRTFTLPAGVSSQIETP